MPAITETIRTSASDDEIRRALTTAAGLQGWWSRDSDISEGGAGGEHELRFDKDGRVVVMRFRVDTVEPTRVQWTCTDNGNPVWPGTTLEWQFGDGSIEFTHDGFAEDTSPPFQMTAQGWKHFCASLRAWLDRGEGMPW